MPFKEKNLQLKKREHQTPLFLGPLLDSALTANRLVIL